MTTVGYLLLAAALSAGNAEFDRASVVGAAEITVARLKADAVAAPSVTGVLVRAMREDPARFAKQDAARSAGEPIYAKAVGEDLAKAVDAALVQLAGTRPPEEVFGTNFVRSARTLTDAQVARVLAGPYTNAFARERRAACEEQARTLVASVRPPMAEVDSDDDGAIRKTLAANIAREGGRTVFEENLDYVSQKLVEPLIADAKREKRRQQEYVRRVRSDELAPSALAKDIAWKLGENVRERAAKTENAALRWDVFPSVTNRTLGAAVEHRVLTRLTDKIAETKMDASEAKLAKEIEAGGEVHRTASGSRKAFHAAYSATLLSDALAADVREADEKGRGELTDYLAARRTSSAVTKAVEARLQSDLDPALTRVRTAFAAREFAARWPTLADRTWYPAADLADEIAARSDFAKAVRSWRKMPEMAAFNVRATLEESDAKADGAVRGAFELARAAVAGEMKAVDEVKASVLTESRARKESFFRRTPDLQGIVRMLTEATLARWGERKNAVLWSETELPKNAAEQHAELFPSVKRQIELVAKEILEEMEKPEPEEKPETPPEETPPEEPKLLYSIVVNREGERVTVKLSQNGKDVLSREEDAKLAPFRAAMKDVADKLGQEIMKLK